MWFFQVKFSSITTPKNLAVSVLGIFILSEFKYFTNSKFFLDLAWLLKITKFVFFKLTDSLFVLNQVLYDHL